MAGVASVVGVESVAGVAGVVFSDDHIYVTPTASGSPSLNARCDIGSWIAEIETETGTRMQPTTCRKR